jgi:uncharacterized protein (UPF0332 family)
MYPKEDLIQYRMGRARDTLEEAKLMFDSGYLYGAANRLYYACFYAVLALLAKNDLSSSKHSGVMGLFNREFVKTGRIPLELGKFYSRVFDDRSEGDYADLLSGPQVCEADLETARHFIGCIEQLLRD